MSWAAGRKTTRMEDRAYSLLGLFGVSMPLIYGEGAHAFSRLRLEIMKTTTDHSLFAWHPLTETEQRGALAISPDEFSGSGHVRPLEGLVDKSSFEMTNLGLRITIRCIQETVGGDGCRRLFAWLNCTIVSENDILLNGRMGFWLREASSSSKGPLGCFYRSHLEIMPDMIPFSWAGKPKPTLLHIIQPDHRFLDRSTTTFQQPIGYVPLSCSLDYSDLIKAGFCLEAHSEFGSPLLQENESSIVFMLDSPKSAPGPWIIFFKHKGRGRQFWVALINNGGTIWSNITNSIDETETPESIHQALKRYIGFLDSYKREGMVDYVIIEKLWKDNKVVELIAKRGIVLVGFVAKISISDNDQDLLQSI
jgi:hypothetical protein